MLPTLIPFLFFVAFVFSMIPACQQTGSESPSGVSGQKIFSENAGTQSDQKTPEEKEGEVEFVPGEIIVKVKDDNPDFLVSVAPESELENIYKKYGTPVVERAFNRVPATRESLSRHIQEVSQNYPTRSLRGTGFNGEVPFFQRFYRLVFSTKADLKEILHELKTTGLFEHVDFVRISKPQVIPHDPFYISANSWGQPDFDLWGLRKIDAEKAWDITTGNPNLVIAVLDTGLDATHPDILQNVHPDFSGNNDDFGHGTFVSGIIAAAGNNLTGMTGVMWNARILPYKVCEKPPYSSGHEVSCNDFMVANAIMDATDAGADVIYLAMNRKGCGVYCEYTGLIHPAVEYAYALGVAVVAPAGNSGSNAAFWYPSAYPRVFSVGSSDLIDQASSFSNYGIEMDFLAPGGGYDPLNAGPDILSLRAAGTDMYNTPSYIFQNEYYRSVGTSASAAYVTGTIGLMLSQDPTLTIEEIRQVLRRSAEDVMDPGWDERSSYGRMNAYGALESLSHKPVCEGVILSPANYALKDPISNDVVDVGAMLNVFGQVGGRDFDRYSVAFKRGYQLPNTQPTVGWSGVTVANPNNPVTGILGFTAMSNLQEGGYTLHLTVKDAAGQTCAEDYKYFLYSDEVADVSFIDTTSSHGFLTGTRDSLATGDFNDDGFDDLVMGSPVYSLLFDNYPGYAYLSFGNLFGLGQDIPIEDPALVPVSWKESNYPLNPAGDFNMHFGRKTVSLDMIPDKNDEIVLSAPGHRYLFYKGLVCIYPGSSSTSWGQNMLFEDIYSVGNPVPDSFCFYGPGDHFVLGSDIKNIGDVNGDGLEELAVVGCGTPYEGGRNQGYVYIVYGGTSLGTPSNNYNNIETVAGSVIYVKGDSPPFNMGHPEEPVENPCYENRESTAPFGRSLVRVVGDGGDLNGDGYDDVIVTADGKSYVFYGSNTGLPPASYTEADEDASFDAEASRFVGDVNDDGRDDLFFSNTLIYGNPSFSGPLALSAISNRVGYGAYDSLYDISQGTVVKLGDINADGIDDFAVSQVFYEGLFDNKGIVWVICGNKNGHKGGFMHTVADFYLKDDAYNDVPENAFKDDFGQSLSSGDYNGDGYQDIAVGSGSEGYPTASMVYEYFGPFTCTPQAQPL